MDKKYIEYDIDEMYYYCIYDNLIHNYDDYYSDISSDVSHIYEYFDFYD